MAYDIGPRIGIKGEKKFNDEIRRINSNIKLLGSELNALTKEYDGNNDSLEFLTKKSDIFTKELEEQKSKLSILDKQYKKQNETLGELNRNLFEVTQEFGKNSVEAAKAENAVRRQEEIISKLGVSINETKGYISQLNHQIKENINKINEVSKVNKDSENTLKKLTDEIKKQEQELSRLELSYQNCILSKGKDAKESRQLANEILNLSKELNENKNILSKAQVESKKLSKELNEVGNSAKETKEGFTVMKGAIASISADGIRDVTNSLKDVITQSDNASASFAAMTGVTAEEMKKYDKVIKSLYKDNFGDSMEDIAVSVAKVKQQMKELNEESLEKVTAGVKTLEDTFDMDFNETIRGTKQLVYQFGLDAEDALDLIAEGSQKGLNYTDELGDNLAEYSGKFAQAGYSATEYFQLLYNGSQNGAYNLDKINDAINEVTNRLADGTIEDSLSMFNKETQQLFNKWKNGGATQKQVIDAIVKDIQNTTNEQEKLAKAAEAFGTMGEDANAKFVESLSSVGDEFDDVKGKMEEINKVKYNTVESRVKSLGRTFQLEFFEPVVEDAMPYLEDGIEWLTNNIPLVEKTVVSLGLAMGTTFAVKKTIAFKDSIIKVGDAFTSLGSKNIPLVSNGLNTVGNLLKSNPWGIAIGGAVALGTALFALSQKEDEATKAIRESAEEAVKATESFNQMRDATAKNIQESQGQFDYYQKLKQELQSITDANGKVTQGYESRAKFIIGELNNALGTEITMVGNVIQSYQEQMDALDKLIEKQRAKAYIDANQNDYQEAVKNQNKALKDMIDAENTYLSEKKRVEDELSRLRQKGWDEALLLSERSALENRESYKQAEKNYQERKKLAEGYTSVISQQEYLLQLYAEGSAESINKINQTVANSYIENGKLVQLSLEEQIKIEESRIAMLKQKSDEQSQLQLNASQRNLEILKKQLGDQNQEIKNNINHYKSSWEMMVQQGINAFNSKNPLFLNAAFEQTLNAKKGINQGTEETSAAWSALANQGYAVLNGNIWQYTKAGEEYINGINVGMQNKSSNLFSSIYSLGTNMINTLLNSLDIHSPSKLTTEAGDFFTQGLIKGVDIKKNQLFKSVKGISEMMINGIDFAKKQAVSLPQESFALNSSILSNTKAVFESKQEIIVQSVLDGRVIAENTTTHITKNQAIKNVMKGKR